MESGLIHEAVPQETLASVRDIINSEATGAVEPEHKLKQSGIAVLD